MLVNRGRSTAACLYSTLSNGPFASVNSSDIGVFEGIVGRKDVLTQSEDIEPFNTDWTRAFKGKCPLVLLPKSTEEVSAIMKHCYERRIALCPQAGNTGLVGGGVPVHDEVVLSTRKLRNVLQFDPESGVLECDAGFILQELDEHIGQYGYTMPFDLGAKGSCLIGGNISTCAGGVRLLRYGTLHSHLLGMTAVVPDSKGSVLRLGSSLRKDNSSLHMAHLFLGAEGGLGVVTNIQMTAVPKPSSVQNCFLGVTSFDNCRKVLSLSKKILGEILSAFELMDKETMVLLKENMNLDSVLPRNAPFNLLIETSGSNEDHDRAKMAAFIEACFAEELVVDGVLAESAAEGAQMWKLREHAPVALTSDGFVYKYDLSLPMDHFYELTEATRERVGSRARRVVTYGHMGDGNTHLNITADKFDKELYETLNSFIYQWVVDRGGSVSAEHGVGQLKLHYACLGKSSLEREMVKSIRELFDPRGIMNPYKFIEKL